MNIYENLKNDKKIIGKKKLATTRNLDPVIVGLPNTPMTISIGCQTINLDHQNPQSLTHLGYVKLHGFHDNL